MLQFFRKYQRYIYIVITVVIVISFSFFGTYSAMQRSEVEDPVAFVAVDGTQVTRSELESMVHFIGTDSLDKRNLGGIWGPNFFNDGVIRKDILETGAAEIVVGAFPDEIRNELAQKHLKEKQFKPYQHPQAGFISAESVWNYFAPGMKQSLSLLQLSKDPLSSKAFEARVRLYLSEKQFPAPLLKNMLYMQERQNSWIEHDPNLNYADLSLFGYHTTEEWFGPSFMRLVAEFIINSSIIAEKRGYIVTKEEAYADLIQNASISFQQNQKSPHLAASNLDQYVEEQLRRMQLDKNKAIKLWQKVLLFRRLFHEMGDSVFVAPLMFNQYNVYAHQGAKGTLYELPEALQFSNARSLHKFETYLDAVSSRPNGSLDLPSNFKDQQTIAKENPQLIQKRYKLEVASASKSQLQSKVSIKEMWDWEVQEQNWQVLSKQFPELALKKASTREERFAALDALDPTTRANVDTFARKAIVDNHPEWIAEALNAKKPETMLVNIPLSGGNIPFKGVKNRQELLKQLDSGDTNPLKAYTGDNENFYNINVIEKAPKTEVMTYAEADKSGVLDKPLDDKLEAYYTQIRSKYPKEYKNQDGSWKSYSDVYDSVADKYFDDLMKSIGEDYVKAVIPKDDNENLSMSRAASLRFIKHMENAKSTLQNNPEAENSIAKEKEAESTSSVFGEREPLNEQWKLIKRPYQMVLSSHDSTLDKKATLALGKGDISKTYTPPNGDLYFFHVEEVGADDSSESLIAEAYKMQGVLSDEAQRALAAKLLAKMKEDGNLSLDYFLPKVEVQQDSE